MFGSATMSVIVLYGLHSPTSSSLAYVAAAVAFFLFGLQTPSTSPSRTPVQPSMWNFALKPEPMNPTPRRPLFEAMWLVAGDSWLVAGVSCWWAGEKKRVAGGEWRAFPPPPITSHQSLSSSRRASGAPREGS